MNLPSRLVLSIGLALLASLAIAAPPSTINYQGYLTSAAPSSTPVTDTLSMTFRLYDSQTVGTLLFGELQSVTVNNGVFNVVLGTGTLVAGAPLASLTFSAPYFLEVLVGAELLAPRRPLSTSPYAFRAALADSVAAGASGVPTPSNSVVALSFGLAGSGGSSTQYARGDHGHAMPSLPALSGDLAGSIGSPITVTALRGTALSTTLPLDQQILTYSSSSARAAWQTLPAAVFPASPSITGNLILPGSGSASAGTIMKGGTRFMHYYGFSNTFIGEGAGNFVMSGGNNTGSGVQALLSNTSGTYNTANGANALFSNTTGGVNTAEGSGALQSNTTGTGNTVSGAGALQNSISSSFNTVSGVSAMVNAGKVVAAGSFAPTVDYTIQTVGTTDFTLIGAASNTVGAKFGATGVGSGTGTASPDVDQNTVSGYQALYNHANGRNNTASGYQTLFNSTTSHNNTAMGYHALYNTTTGVNNIAIGLNAGVNLTTGFFNINIGNDGVAGDSYTTRIGSTSQQFKTFIAGINGAVIASGNNVFIDSNGQLGTSPSSRRYKDDITDMDTASSALMQLRPVTFHYKTDQNPAGRTLQYGLIAEEVNDVYPGLVAHSADGQIETVMYQHLPPMLLNEFQKQQRTIGAQATAIQNQAAELAQQRAKITELEQKSARLEAVERRLLRIEATLRSN